MLTDGVQPSDMANSIFDTSYEKIKFHKKDDFVIGEFMFSDEDSSSVKMRYVYSQKDRKLLKIEEESKENKLVLWDRELRKEELLDRVVELISEHYSRDESEKFLEKLPKNLRNKAKKKYMNII